MEQRAFELRKVDDDTRTVSGIAVPFGEVINVGGFQESFERGSIQDVANTKLFWNHKEVIGRVIEGRETEDGFEIRAQISDTTHGNDAYVLLKDGVVDKFSVGFVPVEQRDDNGVTVRTKVDLKEVSLVPFPAYSGASVTEIRSAQHETVKETATQNTQGETTMSEEVVELRGAVEELERKVALIPAQRTEEVTESQYRSLGTLVNDLYTGKDAAKTELRAYTGDTFENNDNATRPSWANKTLELVQAKRTISNLFGTGPLPAEGFELVYPQVTARTGTVAVQVNEGDDLPFIGATYGTGRAEIQTVGGFTSMSRQLIERSGLPVVQDRVNQMVNEYARHGELRVLTALVGATGTLTGTLAGNRSEDWLNLVLDASEAMDDENLEAEVMLVSSDILKRIVNVKDTSGRHLFAINGDSVNSIGSLDVRGQKAVVSGMPVVKGSDLPAGSCYVLNRSAITVHSNGIASLQDENIRNLTKDFSVYGYQGVALNNLNGIVKVDTELA